MARITWTADKDKFLRDCIAKGIHPKDMPDPFEDRFGVRPAVSALKRRCSTVGLKYSHLVYTGDPEPLEEIRKDQIYEQQIAGLKHQLSQTERRYKEALKGLDWQNNLITAASEYIKALPRVAAPKKSKAKDKTVEEALLCVSDVHYGEIVRASEMRGLNEYNPTIASARLKILAETVLDLATNKLAGYNFTKLNILGIGDWISGNIHDELVEQSDGNVVTWTIDMAYIMAQFIRDMLTVFPCVEFTGVVGNHGRMHKKPRFKERYVNWDYLSYQYLSMFLANEIQAKRVVCDIPESFWINKHINGVPCLVLHGDNINSWAGIPWYGITRASHKLKELLAVKREFFDYVFLGHFHNLGTLDAMRGETVLNGSVIGGNEYSIGKMYTVSRAGQWFCGIHPRHGMTWRYPIELQNRKPSAAYQTPERGVVLGSLMAGIV